MTVRPWVPLPACPTCGTPVETVTREPTAHVGPDSRTRFTPGPVMTLGPCGHDVDPSNPLTVTT